MGRGRSKGGGTTLAPAPTTTANMPNVPKNVVTLTDSDADKLRQQQDSMYDANTTAAVKMYISDTNFDGQGHSLSQTMNYLEENGVDLNSINGSNLQQINRQYGLNLNANDVASMQYTSNYMALAVHPIGKDIQLQRGCHDDLLKNQFGISDYTKMSTSQLQQQLVGKAFQNTSYMSTSYDMNKNPFLSNRSGSGVSGGREVILNIKAGQNTQCLFGAKKQSEIILGKGQNFKITGVRDTGNIATPRGKGSKRQIEIDIETF